MSNYKINNPDGVYFVTLTVVEWVDVFTRKRYVEIVLDSLRHCQQAKGLVIYAWCIMSNHVHLIIAKEKEPTLSDILRDFKKYTSSQIIKSIKEEPESRRNWMLWIFSSAAKKNSNNTNYQFWQQNNQPKELISNEFMEQKLDYIHLNPVEAGIVEYAKDYLYSSARDYEGSKGLLDIQFIE
ncbi:MAG: transposase [Microscillaceae bacterium]|nr:transposase [Microscillaceae bacterium]